VRMAIFFEHAAAFGWEQERLQQTGEATQLH